jgi:hypothetical protein
MLMKINKKSGTGAVGAMTSIAQQHTGEHKVQGEHKVRPCKTSRLLH